MDRYQLNNTNGVYQVGLILIFFTVRFLFSLFLRPSLLQGNGVRKYIVRCSPAIANRITKTCVRNELCFVVFGYSTTTNTYSHEHCR